MNPTNETTPSSPIHPLEVLEKPDTLHELNQTKLRLAAAEAQVATLLHKNEALNKHIALQEENSFFFALSNLDAGQVLVDAGSQLQTLCAAVRKRDAKGRISLSIVVKPFKGDALVFVPDVKVTEPKPDPAQSVFYSSDDGALSRQDPRQLPLGFAEHSGTRQLPDDFLR